MELAIMEQVYRSFPKNGYDNESKQQYRNDVWESISSSVKPYLDKDKNAKVLLMPSIEGQEIDTAIKCGINPEQIVAIDENPAIIASSKWRKKHPTLRYFTSKVSDVGIKLQNEEWYIAGANLDFCNGFSNTLVYELNTFLDNCPIEDECFTLGVTVATGRESKALSLLLDYYETPDVFIDKRLRALWHLMNDIGHVKMTMTIGKQGKYVSSRQPMTYMVLKSNFGKVKNIVGNEISSLERYGYLTVRYIKALDRIEQRLKSILSEINLIDVDMCLDVIREELTRPEDVDDCKKARAFLYDRMQSLYPY